MNALNKMNNQRIAKVFYLLAAAQILQIAGGLILGLLVAPASLFVSRTETESLIWIVAGFAGLMLVALGLILILLSIAAAFAFRGDKSWRKIAGLLTSGSAIFAFPCGTIIGLYLLRKITGKSSAE